MRTLIIAKHQQKSTHKFNLNAEQMKQTKEFARSHPELEM